MALDCTIHNVSCVVDVVHFNVVYVAEVESVNENWINRGK